jgi:hypothetical protein
METGLELLQSFRKDSQLAIVSFSLGLLTILFPGLAIHYLITANGGPGYLQSLFCGIPFTFASMITGGVSLAQIRKHQAGGKGRWMAVLGIAFGVLFFVVSSIMVAILIIPFFVGIAH